MKKFLLTAMLQIIAAAAVIAALSVAPVHAAQQSSNPPEGEKQTITISKAMSLRNALLAATGTHDVVTGQGASQSKASLLYDIDSKARWALNDDIVALNSVLDAVEKNFNQLRAAAVTANGGLPLPANQADMTKEQLRISQKLTEDIQAILDDERQFPKLFQIKREDLKEPLPGFIVQALEGFVVPASQ